MIPLETIHEKVCKYFLIKPLFLFNRTRRVRVLYMRQIFHYLSKKMNGVRMSYVDIGSYLCDDETLNLSPFDHATVMNSCKKIEGYLTYDKDVIKDVENIINLITEKEKTVQ